jgi:Caspase domain
MRVPILREVSGELQLMISIYACLKFVRFIWFLLLLGAALPSQAATRHAFVVGVNTYDNLASDKQLAKAVNDARAVGETLTGLGFNVSRQEDLKRAELNKAWQVFLARVQPGDMVAVFFSGHGVQVGGINYLLPRDVPKLSSGEDGLLRGESISLQQMLDDLKQRRPGLSLVIIDACRKNPFPLPGGKSVGGTRGLARIDPPEGTFVMYSAGAGENALDRLPGPDPEATSIFTRSLLPLLKTPDLKLQDVALQTREAVRKLAATVRHKQTPAYYDEISGPPVCLAGVCRDLVLEQRPPTPVEVPVLPPIAPAVLPLIVAPLKCDPDEREINGKCVTKPVSAKKCDPDENLVNGKCVTKAAKMVATPPKKCDPDEKLVGGKCLQKPVAKLPVPSQSPAVNSTTTSDKSGLSGGCPGTGWMEYNSTRGYYCVLGSRR